MKSLMTWTKTKFYSVLAEIFITLQSPLFLPVYMSQLDQVTSAGMMDDRAKTGTIAHWTTLALKMSSIMALMVMCK